VRQCQNLQKQILHYRPFLKRFDPLSKGRIKAMIAELEQRKEAMHCDRLFVDVADPFAKR
jgi:hypothetical protein